MKILVFIMFIACIISLCYLYYIAYTELDDYAAIYNVNMDIKNISTIKKILIAIKLIFLI